MRHVARSFVASAAALALALGFTTLGRAGPGGGTSGLEIVFPSQGSVVNRGTLVVAKLAPELGRVKRVRFWYAPVGQTRFQRITGVAQDPLSEHAVLWDAGALASGDYVLRAKARGRIATLTVHVNEPPVANAAAQPVGMGPLGQVRIRFDASGSADADGQVTSHEWDFGDGTTGQGPVVEHEYQHFGTFPLGVTVRDAERGETTGHYVLTTAPDPAEPTGIAVSFRRKQQCGCKKMDVKASGAVEGPAGFDWSPESVSGIPEAEQGNLGPYNDGVAGDPPVQLDTTKSSFAVFSRFEVIAELHDQSKPQLCAEGQRTQRTKHSGGRDEDKDGNKSADPRYDSSQSADDPYSATDNRRRTETGPCGYNNRNGAWCDDGYHGGGGADGTGDGDKKPPNGYKTYEDQKRILWLDAPGWEALPTAKLQPDGAFWKAKYEAKVSGALGECKCSWEVLIEIDKDGKVQTNKVHNKVCQP